MSVARRITEIHTGTLAWAMLVATGSVFGLPTIAEATPVTTGLVFWLDADDQNSITVVDGKVQQWVDKSGSGLNVTQGSAGLRPDYVADAGNGQAVVRFNGTSTSGQYLTNSSNTALLNPQMTMFITASVARVDQIFSMYAQGTGAGNTVSWVGTVTNTPRLIYQVNNAGVSTVLSTDPNVVTANQAFVYSITSSGTAAGNTALFLNGQSVGNGGAIATPATGPISIGYQPNRTDRFFDGDIAEILIYDRVLDSTELAAVEDYLQAKIVPEPAAVALLAGAGLAVAVARRRRVRG